MSRRNRTHRQWQAMLVVFASIAMAASSASQTIPPQGPSASVVDQDLVRRHLTAARNLLSDVTELPAAPQLTGDTRTQVQRLISNFNELIAAGSDWRDSYAKVAENLDGLLRQQAPPSGQPGAVGTTGTVGAAPLDASIHAKLVEFRNALDQFEAAASGNPPAARDQAEPARKAPVTPQDLLVHIEAVEVILGAQAEAQKSTTAAAGGAVTSSETPSGSTRTTIAGPDVTLNAEQLEQIRAHLAELRRLVEQK
jgi:hypothetical protein